MAPPVYVVGQVVGAADVNSWFLPLAAYKLSTLTRSSTTLTADPDIQLALAASSVYEVRGMYIYQGGAANVGFKLTYTVPSGASGGYGITTQSGTFGQTWGTTINVGQVDTTVYATIFQGTIVTSSTAGNLVLTWGSNTSGQNMTMGVGSKITAVKVG